MVKRKINPFSRKRQKRKKGQNLKDPDSSLLNGGQSGINHREEKTTPAKSRETKNKGRRVAPGKAGVKGEVGVRGSADVHKKRKKNLPKGGKEDCYLTQRTREFSSMATAIF